MIGVPTGKDELLFNSNRVYGPVTLAQLFANWEQVYSDDADMNKYNAHWPPEYQSIHIVRKNLSYFSL